MEATIPSQRGARLSLPSEHLRTVEVSLWQDLYSLLGKLIVTYEMEPRIKGKIEIVLKHGVQVWLGRSTMRSWSMGNLHAVGSLHHKPNPNSTEKMESHRTTEKAQAPPT